MSNMGTDKKNKHFIRLVTLHNRAIKIMNFVNFRETASPLYKELTILKLSDNIRLHNFLYVLDDINNNLPPSLNNTFQLASISHDHTTHSSSRYTVRIPAVKNTVHGLRSIKFQACHDWNFFNSHFKNESLHTKSKSFYKNSISKFLLQSY